MMVVQEYITLEMAATIYDKSTRTIRRRLEANPRISTGRQGKALVMWMPALHAEMMKPVNKGGRPRGSARPRWN
ncbi:MAG: hypothetical protein EPO52_05690 [Herbiconiux sp.]|uniref:hypothetical protein n=1 Tax=Herbiconiux sp. TaxID=1871186 RepID=UPI001221BE58|nr:hypothetical protein [Herbiconiux sp.]TAJ48862.1 MAG: hypothetical protein EPO52_05690 [Herbiconiux sp.]